MNIIHKLLLLLSLSMTPAVTVSAQAVNNDFDTFQTAEEYLADFDYLTPNTYRITFVEDGSWITVGRTYIFYAFPTYYDINLKYTSINYKLYYQNDYYNFFQYHYHSLEQAGTCEVLNYVGEESIMPFLALDYNGMSQVIEHDKAEISNSISIYNSFYNFFTGFFPNEVVAEYHGIFTFIVVGFLLFLVFGFVFFLFRVIRRLVGFK